MKKFFKEFKEFITRGNVLDMAVGIIIGGAFTAIITALVTNILNPLLAMIPGTGDTGALQVVLREVKNADGTLDIANSVILDFGAVISAIVTFILTALVLFIIVKSINTIRANGRAEAGKRALLKKEKAIRKQLKKGEITEAEAEAMIAELYKEPEEEEPEETTADVLKEIRDLLKANKENKEENINE